MTLPPHPEPVTLGRAHVAVLRAAADGRTVKEIAAAVSLSPDTVKTYLHRAAVALEAPNRVAAVVTAARLGLLGDLVALLLPEPIPGRNRGEHRWGRVTHHTGRPGRVHVAGLGLLTIAAAEDLAAELLAAAAYARGAHR